MADKFTIVSVRESFRLTDAGEAQQTKQVLYRVGDDGPFSVEIPTAEFDPDNVREVIGREAEKILRLRNGT